MATSSTNLRSRRTEAQLHALAGVEREIRANDPNGRRKYVKDFSAAFCNYQRVLSLEQMNNLVREADILLIGDYHALPAAQKFAADLVEERAQPGDRPVVLGLETIFARDQHIVQEWWRREIDETELRERIRFDLDWGYDWAPFYDLLVTAREHTEAIYGLDCMPREDLRRIGARDRHAAHKIAEIRQRHPQAVLLVLFGESHLAPGHLPQFLREELPADRVLTLLQNVDTLYWHAAGEPAGNVQAVQVRDDVVCVFNSTPLEKYENYRLHLSRWCRDAGEGPDLAPTIYNLIHSLIRFLDIKLYSPHNSTQPKFLVDSMPEIYGPGMEDRWHRLLIRCTDENSKPEALAKKLEECGCAYLPAANAIYMREFQMMYAAEQAARFLHHACLGLPERKGTQPHLSAPDEFCVRIVEHALGYFGSRILYPGRAPIAWEHGIELTRARFGEALKSAISGTEKETAAEHIGYAIGSQLYDLYVAGKITRTSLRHLYLTHLDKPGSAQEVCLRIIGKARRCRKARLS
jgi:Haem-binding uptake, Tiki superfamily, ChaN